MAELVSTVLGLRRHAWVGVLVCALAIVAVARGDSSEHVAIRAEMSVKADTGAIGRRFDKVELLLGQLKASVDSLSTRQRDFYCGRGAPACR